MAKRQFLLFLCFLSLFTLFILFQNFSFAPQHPLKRFVPDYNFKESLGNLELPQGFSEHARGLSSTDPVIFDEKKFLKDTMKNSPAYRALKDFVEVSPEDSAEESCLQEDGKPCIQAVNDPQAAPLIRNVKFKTNLGRQEASLRMNTLQDIDTHLNYCAEDSNVSLRFQRQMTPGSNVQLKMDSKDQSSSFLWSLSW